MKIPIIHSGTMIYSRSDIQLINKARTFATAAHFAVGQKRKYTGDDYIVHPRAVTAILYGIQADAGQIAAAWLHDTVEDTGVTAGQIQNFFGEDVSKLVWFLTDASKPVDGSRAVRKKIDRDHIASAPHRAQTVKLADLIDNSRTILEYDLNFSKTFIQEKSLLLEVLTKGDQRLQGWASEIVNNSLLVIGNGMRTKRHGKNGGNW